MPAIVLATLNARYHHAAFGLRYLWANLGELQPAAVLREFTIQQSPVEIVEALLRDEPRIIGLGVYIWNVTQTTQVVSLLKRLRPEITIIVGGPEVSYEIEGQPVCRLADVVITGEADLAFADVCRQVLAGVAVPQVVAAPVPSLADLVLPYELYTDEDLAHRVIYVEASRGCPFTCEFCLSALDIPVRQFPLEPFLAAMQRLFDRGARQFKFVDRTFNLNLRISRSILEFFLARYVPGLFLHFEMIPDRLPDSLRELIVRFPTGALQFEVGIQTFNEDVSERISRRQDNALVTQNLRWLRAETGVHVHADLIVGLPGESLESFAAGFDRLVELRPQEIQVGILKRLRGTPIVRHDDAYQMVYAADPPYEILQTADIDFATMQELRRFAKTWDLIANSGNFVATTPLLWTRSGGDSLSPFAAIRDVSRWLYDQTGTTHSIALPRLVELLFAYLAGPAGWSAEEIAPTLYDDYQRSGRSDVPRCLRGFVTASNLKATNAMTVTTATRQRRHQQL